MLCYRCEQREEDGEGLCNTCNTLEINELVEQRSQEEIERQRRYDITSEYLGGSD